MPESSDQQIAVLMFTDIVGSVGLQRRLGTQTYTRFIARHDELFKESLSYVPAAKILNETGDGFLVRLRTASDAVETALRFQYRLHSEISEGERVQVRIGLHIGEVTEMAETLTGDTRSVGMAINMAARVMDLAQAGQILMTRSVFDDARQFISQHPAVGENDTLPQLQWPAHGRYLFKGNDDPMAIYEVGAEGIAPLTPPEGSEKAKRAVAADEEATLGWRPGVGLAVPRRTEWYLVAKLGTGGFGEVWLAQHRTTKENRVFKFCFDPERLRSFKRELTLFRLLRDALGKRPDIASLYEVSVEAPPFYLESEYVPTGNLSQWAQSRGGIASVPMETRLDLIARIARAVAAAHSVGVIHKDIKPSNVLITIENGAPRPRLADFGIGMITDTSALDQFGITQVGFTESIVLGSESSRTGTRLYAPPEALVGHPVTERGDIYSLGVMLYQMAAGDLVKPLGSGWQRDVDDELLREDIIKCVDVDPNLRFESALELAEHLENLETRREDWLREERLARQSKRRQKFALLAGASTLVLALVAGFMAFGFIQQRNLKQRARNTASQADFLLAGQMLERGQRSEAVAYLARSLENNPSNQHAISKLISTLAASNFVLPKYAPFKILDWAPRARFGGEFGPDGTRIAALDETGALRIWDLQTGEPVTGQLIRKQDAIHSVRFSPDGKRLVTSTSVELKVWQTADGALLREIASAEKGLMPLHTSSDTRWWVARERGRSGQLQVWDLETGEMEMRLPRLQGEIRAISMSPDAPRRIVAVRTSRSGGEWVRGMSSFDLDAGEESAWKEIFSSKRWEGGIDTVRISPDGSRAALPESDGSISVWDLTEQTPLVNIPKDGDQVLELVISPDGKKLVAGYLGHTAAIYHLETGRPATQPLRHGGGVIRLATSPDGTRLLTGSFDSTARVWDMSSGAALTEPMRHESLVSVIGFSADGRVALTSSWEGHAYAWDLTGAPALDTPFLAELEPESEFLAVSNDWTMVAIGTAKEDTTPFVRVLDRATGKPVCPPIRHQRGIREAAFSSDGKRLVSVGPRLEVIVTNLVTGESETKILTPPSPPRSTGSSRPGGRRLLISPMANVKAIDANRLLIVTATGSSRSMDTQLTVWDLTQDPPVPVQLPSTLGVNAVTLTQDGKNLIASSHVGTQLWDLDALEDGEPETISALAFAFSYAVSANGSKLLVGSVDGTARLWSFESGKFLTRPLHHEGPVLGVAFSPDEKTAATLSATLDKRDHAVAIRLWDLETEEPLTPPLKSRGSSDRAFELALTRAHRILDFSPDGSKMLVALDRRASELSLPLSLRAQPAPAWLGKLAEAFSGMRVDEDSKLIPVGYGAFENVQQEIATPGDSTDPELVRWAQWLTADRGTRSVAPGSSMRLPEYVDHLLAENTVDSLWQALLLSPMNPTAMALLADRIAEDDSGGDRAEASWLVRKVTEFFAAESSPVTMRSRSTPRPPATVSAPMTGDALPGAAVPEVAAPELKLNAMASSQKLRVYQALSQANTRLGDREQANKNTAPADYHYRDAYRWSRRAYEEDADNRDTQYCLAQSLERMGDNQAPENEDQAHAFYRIAAFLANDLMNQGHPAAGKLLGDIYAKTFPSVIDTGSTWRYLDDGSDPGTAWREADFDDSHWKTGQAPFGYGDERENTAIDFGPDSDQRHITTYFRKDFTVENPSDAGSLVFRILRDDGIVIYANGKEILRDNIPIGNVGDQTLAARSIASGAETAHLIRQVEYAGLRQGANVLAVEVHQASSTSSDLGFDLEMMSKAPDKRSFLEDLSPELLEESLQTVGKDVPRGLKRRLKFFYGQSLEDAPQSLQNDPDAWYRRSMQLGASGEFAGSLEAADNALRLTPPEDTVKLRSFFLARHRALKHLDRDAEAQRAFLEATGIAARDASAGPQYVDLTSFYNGGLDESWLETANLPPGRTPPASNSFAELARGQVTLDGIGFDVRGVIQLNGALLAANHPRSAFPKAVETIPVAQRSGKIHFLHACAYGHADPPGAVIGSYTVRYAGGQTIEIPIRLGHEVGDWRLRPAEREANKNREDGFEIAWEGSNPGASARGSTTVLFKTTWKNPQPGLEIEGIGYRSAMAGAAPFLVAITLEKG